MVGGGCSVREWLASHREDRRGPTGGLRKCNRTDNESAKMATDRGGIQGYTGVAAVEVKHQIRGSPPPGDHGGPQRRFLPWTSAPSVVMARRAEARWRGDDGRG